MTDAFSQVIVITSGKGGVGKTTSTANIGVSLAKLGKRVVLIDTDIGLRNLDVALGMESRIVYDIVDVITGTCDIKQALIKDKRFEGLYFIPAAQTRDKDDVVEEQMRKLCTELKREFDFILIDCPAGIEQGFKNAVAGADKAIVVTTPDVSSLRDADRVVGLLEENDIYDHLLLINRIRPDMVRKGDMLNIDEIMEIIGIDLIGIIPDDEAIIVSTNKGMPVAENMKSRSGQGYRNIAKRLCGENTPLMELEKKGIFGKIKRRFTGR